MLTLDVGSVGCALDVGSVGCCRHIVVIVGVVVEIVVNCSL